MRHCSCRCQCNCRHKKLGERRRGNGVRVWQIGGVVSVSVSALLVCFWLLDSCRQRTFLSAANRSARGQWRKGKCEGMEGGGGLQECCSLNAGAGSAAIHFVSYPMRAWTRRGKARRGETCRCRLMNKETWNWNRCGCDTSRVWMSEWMSAWMNEWTNAVASEWMACLGHLWRLSCTTSRRCLN